MTVLFSDVTGSTALGELLDPESLRDVMSRYFELARTVVQRHGGTIAVTDNPDGVGSCFEFTLPMTPDAFTAANT